MFHSIKKFWYVFKLTWIEKLVYRANFFLEILSGILSSLIEERGQAPFDLSR
jgi:ABC-type uncharacterized transport system permease subunit